MRKEQQISKKEKIESKKKKKRRTIMLEQKANIQIFEKKTKTISKPLHITATVPHTGTQVAFLCLTPQALQIVLSSSQHHGIFPPWVRQC